MVTQIFSILTICVVIWCGMALPAAGNEHKPLDWTPYPLLRKEVKNRTNIRILPLNQGLWEVKLFPSTKGHDPMAGMAAVPLVGDGATFTVNGGNYHWISAHSGNQETELTLATVHYFGNPGSSPRTMLGYPKSRLEIIPNPLPREFSTYRSGEQWTFQVRFDQQVLPNHAVTLYTPGQPQQNRVTDQRGDLRVVFPPFPEPGTTVIPPPANPRRPTQPFQLAVVKSVGEKQFTTVFQYEYGPAPLTNRHQLSGWLATGLGMVGGVALWRLRKGENA